jgi:hypothetical protein
VQQKNLPLEILNNSKSIALVGASNNSARASFGVMAFLLAKGYAVTPVNPLLAGQEIHGQKVYAALSDIPHKIDMVEIFRNSDDALAVVEEALTLETLPKSIWMQLGVVNEQAASLAKAKGLKVVMNNCPKIVLA